MSNKSIRDAISTITKQDVISDSVFIGTVIDVDTDRGLLTARTMSSEKDSIISNIQTGIGNTGNENITPKVGSRIVVCKDKYSNQYFMLKAENVETVTTESNTIQLKSLFTNLNSDEDININSIKRISITSKERLNVVSKDIRLRTEGDGDDDFITIGNKDRGTQIVFNKDELYLGFVDFKDLENTFAYGGLLRADITKEYLESVKSKVNEIVTALSGLGVTLTPLGGLPLDIEDEKIIHMGSA